MFISHRVFTSSDGWITPVAGLRATGEERARALNAFRCARIVRALQENARHDLLALHEAATGMALYAPRDVTDSVLVAAIEAALANGSLILLASRGERQHGSEAERLVNSVMRERTVMAFEGRKYRFIPSERSGRSGRSGEGDYRPMPEGEARELVARMAKQLAKSADDRASWTRLAAALSVGPSGTRIVVLRYAPTGGRARPVDVPAATPSQLRAEAAVKDWIEVQIQYEDGSPFDGSYAVLLPNGRKTEGTPNADGLVRIEDVDPGSCKLSFSQLDASVWAPG